MTNLEHREHKTCSATCTEYTVVEGAEGWHLPHGIPFASFELCLQQPSVIKTLELIYHGVSILKTYGPLVNDTGSFLTSKYGSAGIGLYSD